MTCVRRRPKSFEVPTVWDIINVIIITSGLRAASPAFTIPGNALVAPLVLQGVVGGGNYLPSGDSNARLPCPFL